MNDSVCIFGTDLTEWKGPLEFKKPWKNKIEPFVLQAIVHSLPQGSQQTRSDLIWEVNLIHIIELSALVASIVIGKGDERKTKHTNVAIEIYLLHGKWRVDQVFLVARSVFPGDP